MRRSALPALFAAISLLAAQAHPTSAAAACSQDAVGRCEQAGDACNPPADGRCTTMPGSSLGSLKYACRCVSPRQWGPQAAGPGQKSCRQRCNGTELTCESSARTYTQRNACVSRYTSCNSHC